MGNDTKEKDIKSGFLITLCNDLRSVFPLFFFNRLRSHFGFIFVSLFIITRPKRYVLNDLV